MSELAPSLFINYRRTVNGNLSDTAHYAKLLYSRLMRRFGENQVFLDEQSIPEGAVYPQEIETRLRQASVVLVLIGNDWLEARGEFNKRRIDEKNDWVRKEIEVALQSKQPEQIIPICESAGQKIPVKEALPESIAALSDLQFSKLRLERLDDDFEAFANHLAEKHGFKPLEKTQAQTKIRRVFVSLPSDRWLTPEENEVKWAIVSRIESLGFTAEIFLDPRGKSSISAPLAWNAELCERVMRRCEGCVILGFPRWRVSVGDQNLLFATEYNHYEAAVAKTLGIPLLVLVQEGIVQRVVFDAGYRGHVGVIPDPPSVTWLDTEGFNVPFKYWRDELVARRDIYLGYCESAATTATAIRDFLKDKLGVTVYDCVTDGVPAKTAIDQLQGAALKCGAAIFLLPKANKRLGGQGGGAKTAEKLVFDAGFFMALQGRERVLVLLEVGAQMPVELEMKADGVLPEKTTIATIEPILRKFVGAL